MEKAMNNEIQRMSYLASRRDWLRQAGCGFGMIGLASLLGEQSQAASSSSDDWAARALKPLAPQPTHFPASAKRVVWIFVNGGPSQVDTWDYKPSLEKADGKSIKDYDASFSNTT